MNEKLEQMIKEMENLQSQKDLSKKWRQDFRKLNSQITDEMLTITDKEYFMSAKARMNNILYGV